jgi:hypothetical protein
MKPRTPSPTFTVRRPDGSLYLAGMPESAALRLTAGRGGWTMAPDTDLPGCVTRGPVKPQTLTESE